MCYNQGESVWYNVQRDVKPVKRRVLVVAPDMNQHEALPNVKHEVEALRKYHYATVLDGDVGLIDITRAVNERNYDILWFAGGAQDERVYLTNTTIGAETIRRLMAASKARLLVLSSCDTQTLPNSLRGLNVHILAGIANVEDVTAASVGMLFARALRTEWTIAKAYYSLNAGDKYLYLPPNGSLEDVKYYWLAGGIGFTAALFLSLLALGLL